MRYLIPLLFFTTIFFSCEKEKDPQACFTYENGDNLIVIFNSGCSVKASEYYWTFGDGTFSVEANPTHQFTSNIYYDVSLRTTSSTGIVTTTVQAVKAKAHCYSCDCTFGSNNIEFSECGTEIEMIGERDTLNSSNECTCTEVTYN